MEVPLLEDGLDLGLAALLDHDEHPLLALAQQDLKRLHVGLPFRHEVQADVHANTATTAHLRCGASDARSAHVLHADHGVSRSELQRRLQEELLLEGIAHLHGGQVVRTVLGDVLGSERGPLDAVFSGIRTDDVDRVARPACLGADDAVRFDQPHAHSVDQRVDLVHRVEIDLSTHNGHTKAVSVVADAAHHTVEQPLGLRVLEVTEAKAVQLGNGTRTHGEDVAVDAADTGGRSLVGLQRTRVVVALNLERATEAIADVHDAGILLPCLDQQMRAILGQGLEPLDGVLVAAMLGPHHRVDAHLGEVGRAAEDLGDLVEFLGAKAHLLGLLEGGGCGGCALGHVANGSGLRKRTAKVARCHPESLCSHHVYRTCSPQYPFPSFGRLGQGVRKHPHCLDSHGLWMDTWRHCGLDHPES